MKEIKTIRLGQDNPKDQVCTGVGAIEGWLMNLEEGIGSTERTIEGIRTILQAMKLTMEHLDGVEWNPNKPKEGPVK